MGYAIVRTDTKAFIVRCRRRVQRMKTVPMGKCVRIINVSVRPWIHRRNVKKSLPLKGRATNLQTYQTGQSVQQMIIKAVFAHLVFVNVNVHLLVRHAKNVLMVNALHFVRARKFAMFQREPVLLVL